MIIPVNKWNFGACWDIAFTSSSEIYSRKSTNVFSLLILHICIPLISFIGTCVTHDCWYPKIQHEL
jgi:hypothetical protein